MTGSRLLIADDHPLVLEALTIAAQSAVPDLEVDGAGTIAEAEKLAEAGGDYALALLDLQLPDARGFSGFMRLQQALGGVPIVIVTAHRRPELVEAARALGAAGFLLKTQPLDVIAGGIRAALAGETVFPLMRVGGGAIADARRRLDGLSGAQLRVLLAMADGRLNKQIAGDLGVTEATVKAHLTAVFRKLGVLNRTQALLVMQPLLGEAGQPPGEEREEAS